MITLRIGTFLGVILGTSLLDQTDRVRVLSRRKDVSSGVNWDDMVIVLASCNQHGVNDGTNPKGKLLVSENV